MLFSMTGFGEAHSQSGPIAVAVEVRTINSRHLKLSLRTSDGYGALEPMIDALVRKAIRRGAVQVNLKVTRLSSADDYQVNTDVMKAYYEQVVDADFDSERSLDKGMLGASPPPEIVAALLSLPGVVADRRQVTTEPKEDWPVIEPVVQQALTELRAMREQEGKVLAADLLENIDGVAEQLAVVENRAPSVAESYRERLTERVDKALSGLGVSVEPTDLIREVAVFADRTDISEETVRLRSHLDQFRAATELPESSGRKLEFISQEMGREVNTIGSKANDAEISQRVVEMKTALERIREQVQNVE
ncbi:MAG: YicC/YloC family endoribonuclease [Planctomycetota bacterium]